MTKACFSIIAGLWLLLVHSFALAQNDEDAAMAVQAPFIELRSGPGRAYPVMHTLRRGDSVQLIKRKTEWVYIKANAEQQGWVHNEQLTRLAIAQKTVQLQGANDDEFHQRRFELGISQGAAHNRNNDGTPLISVYGAWFMTRNISTELTLTHMLGKYAESTTGQFNITHQMWPEWVVSPFITMGVGNIESEPKSTLGTSKTIESDALNWGIGFRVHLKKRFFLRADVNQYVLLTQSDDLDKVETWKLGVGVFF